MGCTGRHCSHTRGVDGELETTEKRSPEDAPPNKALQLTWHSAFQSAFGRVQH